MAVFSRRKNFNIAFALIAAGTASLFAPAAAEAGVMTTVTLGSSGWQASWDSSLDPVLDINVDAVSANAVFIEKIAQFNSLASINIIFTQISVNAVSNIVINDEVITNTSGAAWTDFHMDLLGNPSAVFDPVATAASGAFSVAPFNSWNLTNSNHTFNAFNGVVPNNSFWFPGQASGQLWINVGNTASGNATFVLSETPSVPAPGAIAMLGVAGLIGSRRRRNA